MAFDVQGALKDGYSPAEIADYLASKRNFDIAGARKDGFTDDEILGHLASRVAAPKAAPVEEPQAAAPTPAKPQAEAPGLLSRAADAIKGTISSIPAALAEKVTPYKSVLETAPKLTAQEQQAELDKRLSYGAGPVSQATVAKADAMLMGRAPAEAGPALTVARARAERGEETFDQLAQRVNRDALIERDAKTASRRRFAEENPLIASAAAGSAGLVSGALNIPSVTADAFNQTFVNPALQLAGLKPLPKTPTAFGTEYLAKSAEEFMPKIGTRSMEGAWKNEEFAPWLMSKLAANSPQMAAQLAAAFVPPLRAVLLPGMAGTAAGQSYAQGDDSRVAITKGAIEYGTEMLPLKVFDKLGDTFKGMSVAKQNAVMAIAGQRLAQAGTAITANGITNAIEETAAQFGGNVLDKFFQGKDIELSKGLAEAAVIGAATGSAMSAPQVAGIATGAFDPNAQIARAINENVAGAQFTAPAQQLAVDRLSPYSMESTTLFVQPTDTSSISRATSVDEAIAAAGLVAGAVPIINAPPPPAPLAMDIQAPLTMGASAPAEVDTLGRIEPTFDANAPLGTTPDTALPITLPEPSAAVEQQFGLDKLRMKAPRPQRIQGQPAGSLTDEQLTTIASDETIPAITRRSAAVELQARGAETTLPAATQPTILPNELPGSTSLGMGQPMAQGGTAPALGGVAPGAPELAQQPTPGFQQPGALDTTEGAQAAGVAQPLKLAKTASARNVGKTLKQFEAETGIAAEVYTEPLTEAQQAASALARVMGNTVTFLKSAPGQLPNGFVVPSVNPKDVYIASDADAPVLGVAVHEIAHLLPAPIKAKLDAGMRALFNDQYLAEFAAKRRIDINNTELLDNEIPAYMAQAISERPDFWQDLRAKMGDGDFAEVARVILDKLNTFLAGTNREYGQEFLDRYVTDVAKARDLLSTAYADAMKAQGLKPTQPKGVQRAERIETPAGAGQEPGADGGGEAPSYGTGREGAVSVVGRHYSVQQRQTLNSGFYGQGLKGAERNRLDDSPDPRIRQRIYFYVDQGSGIRPEAGVGGQAHEVRLNNIYDPKTQLIEPKGSANAFESAVLNAGFDGYIAPFGNNQAAAVLLGPKHKAVPVRALGSVPPAPAAAAAEPTTLRKGLLSREAAEIDTTKIPGARVRMGNLEIPADQREAANAELKRIGSGVQFSERVDNPVDAASLDNTLKLAQGQVWQRGRDLKMAMQQRVLDAAMAKGLDVTADNAETREYLREIGKRDALAALKQNANAIGWYDLKTRQALAVMALVHPEIAKNQDARFALTWAMAVTSNGLKVNKNFELAEKVYDVYKKTGRMPTDIGIGTAGNAINDSLRLFNELRVAWGMDNLRKFMQTDFTVSEITGISKELKPGGEHADVTVKGAAILGPKIGNGFFSNLYGNFDSLTMDRWLVRTWGRWTGTLIKPMPEQTAKARERLTGAINEIVKNPPEAKRLGDLVDLPITANTEVDALATAVQEASMDPDVRAKLNESEVGLELRKAGNSLAKYLDGQKEAPQGPTERKFIRAIFSDVLADLQQRPEYADLTMADLQAVLWYAEKRLYETAKEDPNADEDIEGYADDDAPDYANAAADVARQKGVSDARIKAVLKKEERNERPTGTRPANAPSIEVPPAVAAGKPAAAGGFAGREKRQFIGERAVLRARANRTSDGQQSPAFAGDGGADGGRVRVLKKLDVSYTQKWKASQQTATVFRANDIPLPAFVELAPTLENAQQFEKAIADNKAKLKFGAAVYVYPAEDYQGMKLFLADDGQSGVAVKPDGDIVSVFSTGGAGRAVMELAVAAGGRKLDAFDTILPEFYAPHGFKAVARTKWNDDFAPDEWSKETFSEFNDGQPDVVFMVYDPAKTDAEYSSKDGKVMTGEDGYDQAVARQNREMRKSGKGTIQASARTVDSEALFEGLDGRGRAKARAETALANRDDADQIKFIQDNFLDILAELDDSGRIKINCK
jgi:hypothetical protein